MKYFPLFVSGSTLRVLLVGGGTIAAAKLETVAAAGASITVVAPVFSDGVRALAARYSCTLLRSEYACSHLDGHNVVVAATDDPDLGRRIAADAHAAGIWANIVDAPEICDFIFPAILRHDPLQIAISTGGASPVIARLLKQDVEQILPSHLDKLFPFVAKKTALVRKQLPCVQQRRLFWERVIRGPVGRMLAAGEDIAAETWFENALGHACKRGLLHVFHFIAVPSYNPDDLSVRMVRTIGKADVIVYEGGRGMLPLLDRYARRDAEKYAMKPNQDCSTLMRPLLEQGGAIIYLARPHNPNVSHVQSSLEEMAALAAYSFEKGG